jgi:WD40 repeat protein
MDLETLIDSVSRIIAPQSLNAVQKSVIEGAWQGLSYSGMADLGNYDEGYLKGVGSDLWRLLSEKLGRQVNKKNLLGQILFYQENLAPPAPPLPKLESFWEEAVEAGSFFGRAEELKTLTSWLIEEKFRLVGVCGQAGMGKSSLVYQLARQIEPQFERVIWRSLRDAPPLTELIRSIISALQPQRLMALPPDLGDPLPNLLAALQAQSCLVVLDNFETLFGAHYQAGHFRPGYENYGELLSALGSSVHRSSIILTSREKPLELLWMTEAGFPVRCLTLRGLEREASQALLDKQALRLTLDQQTHIHHHYGGNPLALKIVATAITDVLGGDGQLLLAESASIVTGIYYLLESQFNRLTELEQKLLYWLAINREIVGAQTLKDDLFPPVDIHRLLKCLESLQQRSLVESNSRGFTLQPVILEYITDKLVDTVARALLGGDYSPLVSHALIKATSAETARASQVRLIAAPLLNRLWEVWPDPKEIQSRLDDLLRKLQTNLGLMGGYGPGNLLNLYRELDINLEGYDFSGLNVRQANLQDLNLQRVNFSHSELKHCAFSQTFGGVIQINFSPQGDRLVTCDTHGVIHLWDSQLNLLAESRGHICWVWSVCFTADGQSILSAGQDRTLRRWDGYTGECLQIWRGHRGVITAVTASPDGNWIASASEDRTIKLWRLEEEECVATLTGHNHCVWSVAFVPASQTLVSCSGDGTLKLWDLNTKTCLRTLEGHQACVWDVAPSPDGRHLISAGFDGALRIWETASGKCIGQIVPNAPILDLAFSPDGDSLVTAGGDHRVCLWDWRRGDCLQVLGDHDGPLWSVAFHPQGERLASGGDDRAICLWQLPQGQGLRRLRGYSQCLQTLAVSPDNQWLATGQDNETITLWSLGQGNPLPQKAFTLQGHRNRLLTLAFSADGETLISGSSDGAIKIWDWRNRVCRRTLTGHQGWVWAVVLAPGESWLASASHDGTVKLWDWKQGYCHLTLTDCPGPALSLAVSPDGRQLLAGSSSQAIRVWEMPSGRCLASLEAHHDRVWTVAFSPDGHFWLTGGDDWTLKLWENPSGKLVRTFTGHEGQVTQARFLSRGDQFITCSGDQTLKLWDLTTGDCLQTWAGHDNWIWGFALDRPEKRLYSGGADETLRVWDLKYPQSLGAVRLARPYEGMNIRAVRGLNPVEKAALIALGAEETPDLEAGRLNNQNGAGRVMDDVIAHASQHHFSETPQTPAPDNN